jgi:hypothetical protein
MEFEELAHIISTGIKFKLENSRGLSIFARERSKFEGWLKVELCDTLVEHFKDVAPEKGRIDVAFEDWAIELKTVNTNIRYGNVANKHRPITKNIMGVIADVEKLKLITKYENKAVLVVAFPIRHDNNNWQIQLEKFAKLLSRINHYQFHFKNDIPGVIYFGLL